MPELDDDVAPDEPTGTDADESANAEVIIDAALVRAATVEYKDEAEPKDEVEEANAKVAEQRQEEGDKDVPED